MDIQGLHRHPHRQVHRDSRTHPQAYMHTHFVPCLATQAHAYTHMCTHARTHAYTHRPAHKLKHDLTHTHTLPFALQAPLRVTHMCVHTCTDTHKHVLTSTSTGVSAHPRTRALPHAEGTHRMQVVAPSGWTQMVSKGHLVSSSPGGWCAGCSGELRLGRRPARSPRSQIPMWLQLARLPLRQHRWARGRRAVRGPIWCAAEQAGSPSRPPGPQLQLREAGLPRPDPTSPGR